MLDYANLLERVMQYDSEFVMIVEDDVQPAKAAVQLAYTFASKYFAPGKDHGRENWMILSMFSTVRQAQHIALVHDCVTGTQGLIIRRSVIPFIIECFRGDPYAAPQDLFLFSIRDKKKMAVYERTPNLFQHISPHSSYVGAVSTCS